MAQLLVFQRDNTHPDPKIDQQGCWKTGDVVVVAEDGHEWGAGELVHPFKVVHVDGTKEQWSYLASPDNKLVIPKSVLRTPALRCVAMKQAEHQPIRRRRYQYTEQPEMKGYAKNT